MLVDFDKTFKPDPNFDKKLSILFDRLKSERICAMCKNSMSEKDYDHGYEIYHTICKITGMLRDGENGVNCPYWVVAEE